MLVFAVDLGTTNTKVVLYNERLRVLASARAPMRYHRHAAHVEFDPDALVQSVIDLINECAARTVLPTGRAHIVVTGQAESFILLDSSGSPLTRVISWLDERSVAEAQQLAERFDPQTAFAITGEPEPVTTWPATKLRWLSHHRPELLRRARHVLMVKDYLLLRLTGLAVGEETTRGFTYLYDVRERGYWGEMIEFCGTTVDAMPELVPAGADLGPLRPEIACALPSGLTFTVNSGALDHFCGMIGTGSYRAGELNASAGTVLALSLLSPDWQFDPAMKVSFHNGIRPGETVLFTCADSGGVCLSWFDQNIAGGLDFDSVAAELDRRQLDDGPLFMPYLTGVNPPDFIAGARGAFLGLQLRHDQTDLAWSVMEGVAHLLRRNVDYLVAHGQQISSMVSAGGGTVSAAWNQLKADVCGVDLRTPDETDAACRGAAILALASSGSLDDISTTEGLHQPTQHIYRPAPRPHRDIRYRQYESALSLLAAMAVN